MYVLCDSDQCRVFTERVWLYTFSLPSIVFFSFYFTLNSNSSLVTDLLMLFLLLSYMLYYDLSHSVNGNDKEVADFQQWQDWKKNVVDSDTLDVLKRVEDYIWFKHKKNIYRFILSCSDKIQNLYKYWISEAL
jgi:hypothetical protein